MKMTGMMFIILDCIGSAPGAIGVIFCEMKAVIPMTIGRT